MALSRLRHEEYLTEFDDDTSVAAECRRWYKSALERSFNERDWSFARKKVERVISSSKDDVSGMYLYKYPAKYGGRLVVRDTYLAGVNFHPYKDGYMVNLSETIIDYTEIDEDTGFSSEFTNLISLHLAKLLRSVLVGGTQNAPSAMSIQKDIYSSITYLVRKWELPAENNGETEHQAQQGPINRSYYYY